MSINKVILVGNVGKEPDIRTNNDQCAAYFSIATTESWKNKQTGEKQEKTEWHNIAVYNPGLVKVIEKYVKKGSQLYIEGKLITRKWTDKNHIDRYTTQVVLQGFSSNFKILSSSNTQQETVQNQQNDSVDEIDDSIPF